MSIQFKVSINRLINVLLLLTPIIALVASISAESETDNTVLAVADHQGKLYAGGEFQKTGIKPVFFSGRWS